MKKKVKRGQVHIVHVCVGMAVLVCVSLRTPVYLLYLQTPTVSYFQCFALDFDNSSLYIFLMYNAVRVILSHTSLYKTKQVYLKASTVMEEMLQQTAQQQSMS